MRTLAELFDLRGRVALVTGGGRGLDEQIAAGLAQAGGYVTGQILSVDGGMTA